MAKRLRLDIGNQQTMTAYKSGTTIFEVNDDCLAGIFVFLNIRDLLSVRAAASRFNASTEIAYIRQHRSGTRVSNRNDWLELSLNILKQFGQSIKKLYVFFKMDKFELLMQTIVEHCGDTLTELVLWHKKEKWVFGMHRTSVRITKRQMRELSKKFPKLLSLEIEYDDWPGCPYSDDIIQAIPTLKSFSINGLIFSEEDVYSFTALNGQLECLEIWVGHGFVTKNFFDKLDASLPKLKSFELNRVTIEGPLDHPMKDSTRFENLRKLAFGRISTHYLLDGLPSLFGKGIEELELYCGNFFIPNFIESISRFDNLSELILVLVKDKDTPIPSSQTFGTSIVSSSAIKELILRNNQLKKISLYWHHQLDNFEIHESNYRNIVKEKLNGKQWHTFQNEKYVYKYIKIYSK